MERKYTSVTLTNNILEKALSRAEPLPIFDGSHRKEQANIVGCIGEVVLEEFLTKYGVSFEDHTHSTEYDYLINNKISLDLKTKDRTVVPKIYYDNSVPLYNHAHQRPDYYYFISLLRDKNIKDNDIQRFTKAFIVGGIDLGTLEKEGTKWEKGQTDPSNGTKFWTACINVSMAQLFSNKKMLQTFLKE